MNVNNDISVESQININDDSGKSVTNNNQTPTDAEENPNDHEDHKESSSHDHVNDDIDLRTETFEHEDSESPHGFVNNKENNQHNREKRIKTQPSYLRDFNVKLPPSIDHTKSASDQASSTVHPLSNYAFYDNFSKSHKAFLAAITSNTVPRTFNEAMNDEHWREAMQREIKALEENSTWSLETLPAEKHAIDSKWVYKIKYKPNGEVERYKAHAL